MRRIQLHISCASHMRGHLSQDLDLRGSPRMCGGMLVPHAGGPSMTSAGMPTLARPTTEGHVQVSAGHPTVHAFLHYAIHTDGSHTAEASTAVSRLKPGLTGGTQAVLSRHASLCYPWSCQL